MNWKSQLLFFFTVSYSFGQSTGNAIEYKISSILHQLPVHTEIAVSIVHEKEVSYYGYSKLERGITQSANQSSIFEIGSLTKLFTATLYAQLQHRKIYKKEINSFYGFKWNNQVRLKFTDLLTHTSSVERLPTYFDTIDDKNPYKNYSDRELNHYLANEIILNEPTYQYSNLGYAILGHTIGLIEKQSYNNLLEKRLLSQLNMKNSFTDLSRIDPNQLVKGLDGKGNVVQNWEFDVFFPAGGLYSTVEDLTHFVKSQFQSKNKAQVLTQQETYVIDDRLSVGLGWHILKNENERIHFHNGGTNGYTSAIFMNVPHQKAVIVLSNVSGTGDQSGLIEELAMDLL